MARAVYDLQPPNRRTAIGKRCEAVSGEIMQFDDAMLESELDAMIRTRVEDATNATPNASGRRDRGRRRIRAPDRSEGVPGRPLREGPRGTAARRGRVPGEVPRSREGNARANGDQAPAGFAGAGGEYMKVSCPRRRLPTGSSMCAPRSMGGGSARWGANGRACSWTACGAGVPGARASRAASRTGAAR